VHAAQRAPALISHQVCSRYIAPYPGAPRRTALLVNYVSKALTGFLRPHLLPMHPLRVTFLPAPTLDQCKDIFEPVGERFTGIPVASAIHQRSARGTEGVTPHAPSPLLPPVAGRPNPPLFVSALRHPLTPADGTP